MVSDQPDADSTICDDRRNGDRTLAGEYNLG
jgi:hypothetical protein